MSRRALLAAGGVAALATATRPAGSATPDDEALYRRGAELLGRLGDSETRIEDLCRELAPDLAGLTVRTVYGEILQRPGLDLKHRMLVDIVAVAAGANTFDDLPRRYEAALAAGSTPREIVETLIQLGPEVGFPVAQDALFLARDLFKARGLADGLDGANRPQGDPYDLGFQMLEAIGMPEHAEALGPLGQTGIDLDALTVAFVYGEIFNRPGLDRRTRALIPLAAMLARGNRRDALSARVLMARRSGLEQLGFGEVMIQMTTHVGWSEVLDAAPIVHDALLRPLPTRASEMLSRDRIQRQTDEEGRALAERGLRTLDTLTGLGRDGARDLFAGIAPDVGDYFVDFSYGAVFSRPKLDLKTRELATIAAMVAYGTRVSELPLKLHVAGALKAGAGRDEITETIFHMLPYVGFPSVRRALVIAGQAFGDAEK